MRKIALVLLIFLQLPAVMAGETEYSLRKNRAQIQDADLYQIQFPYSSTYGTPDGARHEGKLKLEYDRESHSDITWDYDWRYKVVYRYFYGLTDSSDLDTLSISYEAGNYVYDDYDLFYDDNSDDTRKVRIVEVIGEYYDSGWQTATNPSADGHIPSDIHLELNIKTRRFYALDLDEETPIYFNPNTNMVDWHFVKGAESYDLEWVFIDSASLEYALVKDTMTYASNQTYGPGEDFSDYYVMDYVFSVKEPTRVNVKNTMYTIDQIYPKGCLFFRVRPVGVYTGTDNPGGDYETVKTGKWSYFNVNGILDPSQGNLAFYEIIADSAFATDQNWLYGINFAEDGKSVSTLSYFDGSLRGRQSLVYNTSDDVTLVAENKYDYEGRQTISIIPSPINGRNFQYQDDFNQNMAGNPFEKDDFDKKNPDSLKTDPTGTKGSAQYFSANNTFTDNEYWKSTPIADGFVYTQVKFNRDATGRVSEVAGVGEEFAMGNGHTTKYYYETAKEVELRRLFGDEVGYADNYKKNIVVDPNGQASAAYIDNHGRTVATSIIGPTPSNYVTLDGLSTNTLTTPLSVNNVIDNQFETKSIETFTHLGDTSNYTFTYNFNGVLYGVENPYDTTEVICQDCVYDLYFHIEDPAGDTVSNSYKHYEFSATTISCSGEGVTTYTPSNDPSTIGVFSLGDEGEYKVYKHLVVNYDALMDSIYAEADDLLGGLDAFTDSILANVDVTGCFTNCDTFCLYYSELLYEDETGLDWDNLSTATQNAHIDTCLMSWCSLDSLWDGNDEDQYDIDSLGEDVFFGAAGQCEGLYQQMALQIQPGGVFYDDITLDSVFWQEVDTDLGVGLLLYYSYDSNGSGIGSAITSLDSVQHAPYYQEEWIDELMPYHREYCHYKVCLDLVDATNSDGENSIEFDAMLSTKGPWPGDPNISDYLSTSLDLDPLNNSAIETDVNTNSGVTWLQTIDDDFGNPCSTGGSLDIEDYTDSLWICLNGSGSLSAQDSIDKWNMFVGLYSDKKQDYINLYKEYIDGITNTSDADYQIRGCLYYNDPYKIVFNTAVDEDSLSDTTDFANLLAEVELNNATILSFNCNDQCDIDVPFWMGSFPDTCNTVLLANDSLLYYELETLFYDYCNVSCQNGNIYGWFYDDGSAEYDSIVSFFDTNTSLLCGVENIQIDTTNSVGGSIATDTTIQVNVLSQCFTDLIDLVNLYLPGQDTVSVPGADSLSGCFGSGSYSIAIAETADSNEVHVIVDSGTTGCDRTIMELNDENGNPIDLTAVDSLGNVSASQIDTELAYCDVYLTNGLVMTGLITIAPCIDSHGEDIVVYTAPSISDFKEDCINDTYGQAIYNATIQYQNMLDSLAAVLMDAIDCMDGVVENYQMTYDLREDYYTLFYYDQSGNLVETVPPEGVNPLSQAQFNAAYSYTTHLWTEGTVPDHSMQTQYAYNGANELIEQTTPDGGTTKYYYDDLFRLRFSQNEQQLADDQFSYTIYDELGRVTEAGEAGDPALGALSFTDSLNNYDYPSYYLKRDYTKTYYEEGYSLANDLTSLFENGKQENLRNRIGAVEQRMAQYTVSSGKIVVYQNTDVNLYTSYSYDYHGNVKQMVQTNDHLEEIGHKHKTISYNYDLISGNVKEVIYQENAPDEWRHKYHYDANNRLVRAWTSDDGEQWEMDAKYFYYLHGPLARMEIGHDKVQGCDYEYNMQGWLKGVNSTTLQPYRDIGNDADTLGLDMYSGADAYGFYLGYFEGDTSNVSGTQFFANTQELIDNNVTYGNLYNGNISHMVTAMKDNNESMLEVLGNTYRYDQLNRIDQMFVYSVSNQSNFIANNSFNGATLYNGGAYRTTYSYDKNGNLQTLTRKDQNGTNFDDFTYNYIAGTNQLEYVDDALGTGVSTVDIDDQSAGNYTYNAIGQLTSDNQENITNIDWTVTGKVRKVTQSDGANTEFVYDAMGNRVMKIDMGINEEGATYTYYVHDASGNVMATYSREITFDSWDEGDKILQDDLKLSEKYIYGSKRHGAKNENELLTRRKFKIPGAQGNTLYWTILSEVSLTDFDSTNFYSNQRHVGEKTYELANHLGNVLEVVTDKKIRNTAEDGYEADVVSYTDFFPFGMMLPGRNGNSDQYRYGFQSQEMDNEIKGTGNSINYKYRMHDPRVGRFFAVDPLTRKYPHYTPYSFSGNKVIAWVELEGLEEATITGGRAYLYTGLEPDVTSVTIDLQNPRYDKLNQNIRKVYGNVLNDNYYLLIDIRQSNAWLVSEGPGGREKTWWLEYETYIEVYDLNGNFINSGSMWSSNKEYIGHDGEINDKPGWTEKKGKDEDNDDGRDKSTDQYGNPYTGVTGEEQYDENGIFIGEWPDYTVGGKASISSLKSPWGDNYPEYIKIDNDAIQYTGGGIAPGEEVFLIEPSDSVYNIWILNQDGDTTGQYGNTNNNGSTNNK